MKNAKRFVTLAAAIAVLVAACGTTDNGGTNVTQPPTPDPIKLAGTRWVATAMFLGGAPVPFVPNARPTLEFTDDGRSFGGSTGCNSYFGEYMLSNGTIGFGNIGMTEMACQEPLMTQEANVFAVFTEASLYTIEDGILTIGELGGSALQFEDRAAAFPDAELAGTLWTADTIFTRDAASTLVANTEVTLFIDAAASKATGSTGCNDYGASVEWDDTELTFGQVDVTERGCIGEGIMEQEQFVLSVLQGTLQVEIDGDRLLLMGPNGDGLGFTARP